MAKKVLTDLNLLQNELQNAVVQNLATAPSNPKAGQQYFNTVSKTLMVYDGSQWLDATSQGRIYSEGNGIDISDANVISVDTDVVATQSDLSTGLGTKQDTIEDLDTIRSNASTGATKSAANETAISTINNSDVMKSGITSTKVSAYDTHVADGDIHVTSAQKTEWSGKQDALTETQMTSVNSGADSTKIAQIATNKTNIESIQDTIDNYGTIVLYNAEDYYASNNPSGYQTASDVSSLISTHNSATDAHSDIRTAIDGKVAKNDDITGATKCKITFDAKGLVTAGADLEASDIPDISATYVATSTKGQANGVASLGADGKVPTAQLPSFVDDVIDSYVVGSTPFASDWLSLTEGGKAFTPETGKIYVVLSAGEYLNKTYRWSGSVYVEISASPAQATESQAGIAKLATEAIAKAGTDDTTIVTPLKLEAVLGQEAGATRTLTNKTVDADSNTISNLELDNFKSGVVKTAVAKTGAVDTAVVTEKAVATALAEKTDKLTGLNPALTPVGGICTWTITNSLGADAIVMVKEVSTNEEVFCEVAVGENVVIKMNASADIAEGTYKAIIIG